jgi:ASC-1-like (ASCH) protein
MDDLGEFVEETVRDNDLDARKHGDRVREAIRAAVRAQKVKHKAERESHKARIDAISPEDRESLAGMRVYKFYPSNEREKYPDVSGIKAKYINRYYGQADEVR